MDTGNSFRTAIRVATFAMAVLFAAGSANAQEIQDTWRFTLDAPGEGWYAPGFDDSTWSEGPGGFGEPGTPAARVGTRWGTNDIWMRKTFTVAGLNDAALLIHHDEDATVYLNGQQIASLGGYSTEYQVVPLEGDAAQALREGENLLAVHCHQTGGGQFIDAHIISGANVPELPRPERSKIPFKSALITTWGAEVTPENAWTEYPRPQMTRGGWQNLNGNWDYAITKDDATDVPAAWAGKILVPFSLESKLGGVQYMLGETEALWYHRSFDAAKRDGERTLLNFEAVDYRCEVFVNGDSVGTHQGGNTPFSFDITGAMNDGANTLVVRVEDDTEEWQLRGKQVREPNSIWYTQVSGIWQTVWLEQVPRRYIQDLKISTSAADGSISVHPVIQGRDGRARVTVKDGGATVAELEGGTANFTFRLPDAKLWSPASPHLYDIEVALLDGDGEIVDRVASYAGIRTVGKVKDADGHWRMTLNGEEIYHLGPLDQGWWPDGLLTPPSDEAMLFDVEWLKAAGFNMIRKHIKVEPRRYYYHCDRLGMMLWQDQVSAGRGPAWTRLEPDPEDADWPRAEHRQFMDELERMISSLENHPSIVVWVPFNEAWGQHNTVAVGEWTSKRDPSRLVNVASGGNFWPAGDIVDHHNYPHPDFPWNDGAGGRFDDYIKVIGEFGGHGYPVPEHLWDANRRNWGYGGLPQNKEEYLERYRTSLQMLADFRAKGIAAGVYTQTTDVEGEINGLLTYDRKVIKIPAEELAELHNSLFDDLR